MLLHLRARVPNCCKASLYPGRIASGICHKGYLNTSFSFIVDCVTDPLYWLNGMMRDIDRQ